MEYLYIICIGLLIFFSVSLIFKKNKALSEKIFTSWIVLLLVTVFSFLVYAKGKASHYPLFISLSCDSHLLHGAFLYLYVRAFTDSNFRLKVNHLWYIVPVLILIAGKLYLNYVTEDMDCYEGGVCIEEGNIFVTITFLYKYLVLGTYIFFTWRLYKRYIKSAVTPRETMRLQWIKQITTGVTFLYIGILLLQIGHYIFPYVLWEKMLFGNTLTTLFIFIFLYIGNSYTYLFVSPSKNRFVNLSESFNPNNCQQIIQQDEMQEIYLRLNKFMEEEKPFIKGQLTLKELSELTDIPSASISQSINKLTGKSVTDFINRHRVELLKSKIADPGNKKYKIMILAEECGISSKATLNRIFKQHTDQTPGEYLKKVSG